MYREEKERTTARINTAGTTSSSEAIINMLLSNIVDSTTEAASDGYSGDDDAATVAERKAKGVWLALAAYLVGTFITCANVMVIRAVLTTEALQTRANMYVVSLASSDALVGAMQCG